jgi:CRISPR/Cas system-associated endonuclease Cas1
MKNYYVLSNGRLRREANTLYLEKADGEKKPIPVEDVESLYLYGETDLNSKLLNFLTQKRIPLHVFNYYGFYAGSYYPREYLRSGYLLVRQVSHYSDAGLRLELAKEFVRASAHSMMKTVAYYARRKDSADASEPPGEIGGDAPAEAPADDPFRPEAVPGPDATTEEAVDVGLDATATEDAEPDPWTTRLRWEDDPAQGEGASTLPAVYATMGRLASLIDDRKSVSEAMGVEGKLRERYYRAWRRILGEAWPFHQRTRRPPDNEVNALISFGNSHLYTVCLSEIYRTQLTPTISYLHEPGERRFSLALDLAEIFKPLLADRTIFRLINTRQIQPEHFDRSLEGCYLNPDGRRLFLAALEERLSTTILHRRLGRRVSYRHLIRLECYKLIRHLTGAETYRAFRAWW